MVAEPRLVAGFRRASRIVSGAVMLVGALVFVGWALDLELLNRLLAGRFIMQLNTGAAFLLAGLSLWMSDRRPKIALACAVAVTVTGGFVLVVYALHGAEPGRMEWETAVNFVFVGLALSCRLAPGDRAIRFAQLFLTLAMLGTLIALFTHAYSVKFSFGVTAYTQMTIGTLITFVALCLGALFADPERGWMARVTADSAAGSMARRLYPAVIGIPLLLGWLTLLGEHQRFYNGKLGLAALVLAILVVFVILVGLTYHAIDRTDGQRMRLAAILLEEAERRHIARELHDEIGQSLTALKIHLEMVGRGAPEEGAEQVKEARALVDELMKRVSSLSLDLRPAMLDDLGLLPALVWLLGRYTAQTKIKVQFERSGLERRFPPQIETAAFRVVQEALTNVARHAGVERVTVRAWVQDQSLGVQIADEGKGFSADEAMKRADSSGLIGMRERAAALGGTLTIDSEPGRGVRLTAELPIVSNSVPVVRA